MVQLKTHASLTEQISILENRGLLISDKALVEKTLFNLSYYRLSGYLHDFKNKENGKYVDNLTWSRLKRIYDFDRKLTRILMYALEDVESTLKTRLAYIITSHHPKDPIIYLRPNIYREYNPYLRFLGRYYQAKENNSKLPFVQHHNMKYGGFLPMWVASELFTMGNIHAIYDNLISKYQKEIAHSYNTGPQQLKNWIKNITYTRNHLAHYMRIYNLDFGRTPMNCKKHPRNFPTSNKIFDQIFIIKHLYSDKNEWANYVVSELNALIGEYAEDIELSSIGFPQDWESILRS